MKAGYASRRRSRRAGVEVGRKSARTRWEASAMPWISDALARSEHIYQSSIDALPEAFSGHPSRPSRCTSSPTASAALICIG